MPRPAAGRVTAHDVAARAGVSQPTVSLVLSGREDVRVAAATRERVMRAAEELGYRPNLLARGLVLRRSFAIGVVVPDLANPFFLEVVRGAERVAVEAGYAVLLCDGREVSTVAHLETLLTRQVDGVILDATSLADLPESLLAGLNAVVVEDRSERLAWVSSDASAAGRLAAEHLLGLGHRRLGLVGPANALHSFRARERGFVQTLREREVLVRSEWLRRVGASVEGGQAAMRALLALPERPTAVFCVNDLLAVGALKSCLAGGVAVPGEMSIMGCDDIEMARIVTPELSTVAIPAREIGARAARRLLRQVEGSASARRDDRPLPVRLIARGTTGPAPEPAGA
jgi:DNA-binding LacI/PurR family transcriptional regulator